MRVREHDNGLRGHGDGLTNKLLYNRTIIRTEVRLLPVHDISIYSTEKLDTYVVRGTWIIAQCDIPRFKVYSDSIKSGLHDGTSHHWSRCIEVRVMPGSDRATKSTNDTLCCAYTYKMCLCVMYLPVKLMTNLGRPVLDKDARTFF